MGRMSLSKPVVQPDVSERLGALWRYLASWTESDGGVNGPVVHRCDLKRMFRVHDTPWTQGAVIEGLVELHGWSGREEWLRRAVHLADAQCSRLLPDGSFKWAGHEDDRFSSLVHNALADCALLAVAERLEPRDERRRKYADAAAANIRDYWMKALYREELGGFRMNPVDHYATQDRFVVNMNSVAAEAMIRLDRLRGTNEFDRFASRIGERLLELQCREGEDRGAFAYSHVQPRCFITIYTALALRGLPWLRDLTGSDAYREAAVLALANLERMRDPETGLWYHKREDGVLGRYPIFVAGAGIVGNGMLDAARAAGRSLDMSAVAERMLKHQLSNGALQNFIGYDHPDNGRVGGEGRPCWEDVVPTPNWNAHAFRFLSRVMAPPDPAASGPVRRATCVTARICYMEGRRVMAVLGFRPWRGAFAGLYLKPWRYGLALNGRRLLLGMRRRASRWFAREEER